MAALSAGHASVRLSVLDDGVTEEETLLLPLTAKVNDLDTLVIVAVFDGFARVGSARVTTEPELRSAAATYVTSARPVALLRVDDGASLSDVVRVSRAIRSGGLELRVLGTIAPQEAPPTQKWDACPFPAGADHAKVDDATVVVVVDDDGAGRPGVVHVTRSPALGFPWAAATCASVQHYDPGTMPLGTPRFGRPLGIRFTR